MKQKYKLLAGAISAALLAACGGGSNPLKPINDSGSTPTIVADFEQPEALPAGWSVDTSVVGPNGLSAFAQKAPANGGYEAANAGYLGSGMLDSFVSTASDASKDTAKGRATSSAVTIDKPFFNILIGGGRHSPLDPGGETTVGLLIDGKPLHFLTGDENRALVARSVDLSAYIGKSLSLVVADTSAAAYGFVLADQATLSNAPGRSPDSVVATFDDKTGFSATGDFLAAADWKGVSRSSAVVGLGAISTCELLGPGTCDSPKGSVTTGSFTIVNDYIVINAGGGNGFSNVGVDLIDTAGKALFRYVPDTCGAVRPADDLWRAFDVKALKGRTVSLRVRDDADAGCGFITVDHAFQTASPRGQVIRQKIIGDFDDAQAMVAAGWVATGAFANPASANAWEGTTRNSSNLRIGAGAVSTCEIGGAGCDAPVGTLTSPAFTPSADLQYLNFAMAGGNGTAQVGVELRDAASDAVLESYKPASCGPSTIDGTDDLRFFDMTAYIGRAVKLRLYDEESGGCGFISFDEFVLTNMARGTAANQQVVGDFNDAQAMVAAGWVATGAFAAPTSANAWEGTTRVPQALKIGAGAVSTCEIGGAGCDAPTGTLTSPAFTVSASKPFLNFIMAGGNGSTVGIKLLDGATVVAEFKPSTCGPSYIDGADDFQFFDLSAQIGKSLKVEIYDNEAGGCGFISFDDLVLTGASRGTKRN